MHDLLIALIFVTLVASPVIVAALPMRGSDGASESHTGTVDLRVPSPSASRYSLVCRQRRLAPIALCRRSPFHTAPNLPCSLPIRVISYRLKAALMYGIRLLREPGASKIGVLVEVVPCTTL